MWVVVARSNLLKQMQTNNYCRNCGAYIPTGETKCVACGYDESPIINYEDWFQRVIGKRVKDAYISNVTFYGVFAPGEVVKFNVEIIGTVKNMEEKE